MCLLFMTLLSCAGDACTARLNSPYDPPRQQAHLPYLICELLGMRFCRHRRRRGESISEEDEEGLSESERSRSGSPGGGEPLASRSRRADSRSPEPRRRVTLPLCRPDRILLQQEAVCGSVLNAIGCSCMSYLFLWVLSEEAKPRGPYSPNAGSSCITELLFLEHPQRRQAPAVPNA
jgi:hypothetical protein